MILRFRSRTDGAHIRVAIWSAPHPDHTFAHVGEMTLAPGEWDQVRTALIQGSGADDQPEGHIDWALGEDA